MGHLGISNHKLEHDVSPIFSREEDWVVAHRGGILYPEVTLGQTIEKGDVIGSIKEPFGSNVSEPIRSSHKGVVVGINTSPLIYEGLSIFKIATFLDDVKAENVIEKWDKQQPESYIG